jgi:purine-binding chemotaxis protein CheW
MTVIDHDERSLSFRIAGREYALPLRQIREILDLPKLTHVPSAPPYLLGVFNLVGRVVPVLDVAMKFGLGEMAVGDRSCVVVTDLPLAGETAVVGILIDALGEVIDEDAVERLELDGPMEKR